VPHTQTDTPTCGIDLTFPVTHQPILSNGTTHKLHHLQPFKVTLADQIAPGQDLIVRVSFHSHAYSQAHDRSPTVEAVFLDEGGKSRVFCPIRYKAYLSLHTLCTQFLLNNGLTFESKDRNQRNHLTIAGDPTTDGVKYHVYYELMPSKTAGVNVEFVVKSAYDKEYVAAHHKRREHVKRFLRQCHFKQERVPKS